MGSKYRLCCITKNKTNPAYDGARIGAACVARRLECELLNFTPETPDDPVEQEALLAEALASRPDAILIAPAHPTLLDAGLQKVVDAEIPLIYFVCNAEAVRAETFVTSNNYALAAGIAEYLVNSIGGKGDLVIFEGSPNSPTSAPRTQGFLDAAAANPDINIIARRCGNYQREDARRAMMDVLEQHPEFDGVLSANDFMAMGILDALETVTFRAPIVGVNAMPEAIKAIKAGRMRATAAYDAMTMACAATEAAVRVLSGLPVPEQIELPVDIVDAGNCDAWDRPFEERPLPVWDNVVGSPG
jgi:ribose transport system substrate-binding protein